MSLLEKLNQKFLVHDVDEAGAPTASYYGFINRDGAWYIVKNVGDSTFRYATQESVDSQYREYTAAWTNRASLTYTYIDSINI